jgi:hypothetical protein
MPGFKITTFRGLAPLVPSYKLNDGFATTATNCKVNTTELGGFKSSLLVIDPTKTGTLKTIYRYRTDAAVDLWFHWNEDVDVVKSPVINDTEYKVYYTGTGPTSNVVPKITDKVLANAGVTTNYPATEYNLGVPSPTTTWGTAPTTSGTATTPIDPALTETRYYVYTYIDYDGSESAPSKVSPSVTWNPGQTVNVPIIFDAHTNTSITSARIYVTQTGSTATDFQFTGEVLSGVTNFNDTGHRAEVLVTQTWAMPDPDMRGLTAMPNGILVGFKGNTLMFSEPYAPYAWPVEYRISLEYEIVGLSVTGDLLVIGTNGAPYIVSGATPASMSFSKLDMEQACVSKRSMVSILDGVIYASPDGLMFITTSGSELITKDMITREQWNTTYVPSTLHAYQHDNKYYAFYNNTAGFIFDPTAKHLIHIDTNATGGFNDLITDSLYLIVADKIYNWDSGSTILSYTWKSQTFVAPKPVNFGAARVKAVSYPVEFKYIADGVTKLTYSVPNDQGFRLPGGFMATDFEIQLSGTPNIKSVTIADTISELGGVV